MWLDVTFRCGHRGKLKEGGEPVCHCGRIGVARSHAPAPRITGTASGPHVTTKDLPPTVVSLTDTPLKLTQEPADAG